ncbi:MAG: PAS domain S-box protein [Desulfovibrionaceae bacterium]
MSARRLLTENKAFLIAVFAGVVLFSLGLFLNQAWQVIELEQSFVTYQKRHASFEELTARLNLLAERLIMNARAYGFTGEQTWRERFETDARDLETLLATRGGSLHDPAYAQTLAALEKTAREILNLGRSAMAASRGNTPAQGIRILDSAAYLEQRREFAMRLEVLSKNHDALSQQEIDRAQGWATNALTSAAASLALLLCSFGLLAWEVRRYTRGRDLAARHLDSQVRETTARLDSTSRRLSALSDAMPDALALFRPLGEGRDFHAMRYNPAADSLPVLGTSRDVGRMAADIFPAEARTVLLDLLDRVANHGVTLHTDLSFLHRDSHVWVELDAFPLPSGEAAILYRDVTSERTTQTALRRNEERYRELYNRTPAMLHSIDHEGRLVAISDYWLQTMGYERSEVLNRPLTDFLTDRSREYALTTSLPAFFRDGECSDVSYSMARKDGSVIDILLSAISERNAEGVVIRSLAVARDVTRERRAEQALLDSERRLSLVVEGGNLGLWDWDVQSGEVVLNERWAEILGYRLNEIDHDFDTLFENVHPAMRPRVLQAFEDVLDGRSEFFQSEFQMLTKTGEARWVAVRGRVTEREKDGEPARVSGTMHDIHLRKEAEAALAESEQRLLNVALTSGDLIWEIDAQSSIKYMSDSVQEVLGYSVAELLGKNPAEIMNEEDQTPSRARLLQALEQGTPLRDIELWVYAKSGRQVALLVNGVPLREEESEETRGFFGVAKDITRRKNTEYQLKLFHRVFESAMEGIVITDSRGTIMEANQAALDITGYTREEVLGGNPRLFKSERHDADFYARMWKSIAEKGNWEGEIWNRRKSGEVFPEWLSISSIETDGESSHYVSVFHDISEMKHQESRIRHQAFHDALTGLPNRALLLDRITLSTSRANRSGKKLAVLFVDLDNFKNINDSQGHRVGDQLLVAVARRLLSLVRSEDTVSRIGGDEFLLLHDNIDSHADTLALADRILESLKNPFDVEGMELFITPSIGISLYPDDSADPETLIKYADLAMYRAKDGGKNRFHMYTAELNRLVQRRHTLENDLRRALREGSLRLVYQPKLDLHSGRVVGCEALVRWLREDEHVSPAEFIPLAEETGLISALGELVLDTACKDTRTVERAFPGLALNTAVNLSAKQFQQPDLVENIITALAAHGLRAGSVSLEITETALAGDIDSLVRKLSRLTDLGLSVAVDDFGTGYSSLSYIKRFPLSTLKIDRSFVIGLGESHEDENIVRAIIQLAHNLEMTVVAEGVETVEQLAFLKRHGCGMIQGYLYSRPLALEQYIEFLRDPPTLELPEGDG